jgi:hypothetical protein
MKDKKADDLCTFCYNNHEIKPSFIISNITNVAFYYYKILNIYKLIIGSLSIKILRLYTKLLIICL